MLNFIKLLLVLAILGGLVFVVMSFTDFLPSMNEILGAKKRNQNTYEVGDGNETYTLTFFTADTSGAGTDANVTLLMHGSKARTRNLVLNSYIGNVGESAFEAGDTDTLNITTVDVGSITKVDLSHDNAGPGPAWDLKYLKILKDDKTYFFVPGRTLGDGHPTSISLQPEASARADYTFTVKTATVSGAGTDTDTYFKVEGTEGSFTTGEVTSLIDDIDPLENDNLESFTVTAERGVGVPKTLHVKGEGWHVDYIDIDVIYHDESSTSYRMRADFDDNREIADHKWYSATLQRR